MSDSTDPGTARVECPHCRREVPAGAECPLCGIVFARYGARHRRREPDPTGPTLLPATRSRAPLTRTLLLFLAIALAAFAYDRLDQPEAEAEAEVEPVPAATSPGAATSPPPATTSRMAARTPPPTPAPPARYEPPAQPIPSPIPEPAPDPPTARPSTYTYDWYEDADGFTRGWREAQEEGRAIAVYFHTDWCGYCRQLERELLERAKVENYLKYLTKVKINPEHGTTERAIANRYGVTGYPSLFVHPAADRGPTKVSGMKRRHGEWRVKSPDEFVQTLRRVVGD